MEIVVPKSPQGYACECCVYDEMTTFLKKIEDTLGVCENIKFSVGLVSAGYYCKADGCYGYIGPEYHREERSNYGKTTETLNITFLATPDWVQRNTELLDSLYRTPAGRPNVFYPVWSSNEVNNYQQVTKKYGAYKKPAFDPVYSVMKQYFPDMTEKDFAKYGCDVSKGSCDVSYDEHNYNHDFVMIREYTTDESCLESWEHEETLTIPTGKVRIGISIITTDLERNTDALIKLLTDWKKSI